MEQDIRAILDIQQLKSRYFRYLDTKDWARWRELFTDDLEFFHEQSVLPIRSDPLIVGGDAFVQFVSADLASAVTVHHGCMPDIEITGENTANGIWAMHDWVDDPENLGARGGYGHSHELYQKGADGKWRIKVLRLTRIRVDRSAGSHPDGARPWPPPWVAPIP